MPLSLPDFNLSPEQQEFRDTLRRFFEANAPIGEVRRVMSSGEGFAPELWKSAGSELGLAGIAVPEQEGGQGFGLAELGLALAETGRALAPIPLFATAALAGRVVARVVEAAEDAAKAGRGARSAAESGGTAWLAALAAGQRATLAWLEDADSWALDGVRLEAKSSAAGGYRLNGVKQLVLEGGCAERLFVVARVASGLGLFAVDSGSTGLAVEAQEAFDVTRGLARVRFEDVAARAVGQPGEDGPAIERGLVDATALLCAEMVGGMQRVLETAVDYANARHQFGRPIGSFQAIKHKCADMLIDFEAARTAVAEALEACETGDDDAPLLASVAKAQAGPAYVRLAIESMQIQGGVGYTWEYDAHLYYRRAQSCALLLGTASDHHDRIARILAARSGARGGIGGGR